MITLLNRPEIGLKRVSSVGAGMGRRRRRWYTFQMSREAFEEAVSNFLAKRREAEAEVVPFFGQGGGGGSKK